MLDIFNCLGFYSLCQKTEIYVGPGRGSAAGSLVAYVLELPI